MLAAEGRSCDIEERWNWRAERECVVDDLCVDVVGGKVAGWLIGWLGGIYEKDTEIERVIGEVCSYIFEKSGWN